VVAIVIVWITGGPGAGKTTTAKAFQKLFPASLMLDGDEVRQWLTDDCDFSEEGRKKHAQRLYEIARRTSDIGRPVIVAVVAHPPGSVNMLVYVDGPFRRPLWAGSTYDPPKNPDLTVNTWEKDNVQRK
jgi:adenylylsulfate kinase-like enzyme